MADAAPNESTVLRELASLVPERGVAAVEIRPHACRTSHWLAEVAVTYADGSHESLILKDLGPASLSAEALKAKPEALFDPVREIEVYRDVLAASRAGTARLVGAVVLPEEDRHWLFLERLSGAELYQVGEIDVWCATAAQLARLHRQLVSARTPSLLVWDAARAFWWLERAVAFSGDTCLRLLRRRYGELVERLESLPRGFSHGELYASNVIVDRETGRVSPIDWEMAGVGPQLLDLAALTSGMWSDADRRAIACAYQSELGDRQGSEHFLEDLDACRLYLAVQWLGWARMWSPPAANAHDWAMDVSVVGQRLGLI